MSTVVLQGQISRIFNGKRADIITLYVRGRRTNFPQVIFTGAGRGLLEGFKQGDYVNITGTLKTRGERQESGRILHSQFIKCTDIALAEEVDNVDDFQFINDIVVDGSIVKSSVGEKMITLLVNPDGERFNIWVFKYCEDPEAEIGDFEPGSKISAQCEVQTSRKDIRGEIKFFENIVIKEANTR